jgi:hypothetical protein
MTLAELRTRALQRAGIIGAEEAPSAADAVFVESFLTSTFDQLAEYDLLAWESNSIPAKYADAIIDHSMPDWGFAYGLQAYNPIDAEAVRKACRARLRAAINGNFASSPEPVEYF